jgi:hypothetical protein
MGYSPNPNSFFKEIQMSDNAQEMVKEPKAPKAPKVAKEKPAPKPPRLGKKWTEETWAAHLAQISLPAVPDGWLNMAAIVKQARDAGIKTSRICTAMGGDRDASPVWDDVFKVVYVGGRKYGSPEILTTGFALLLDPEYHKPARRGKAAKEPELDADGNPIVKAAKPIKKLKVAAPTGDQTPWKAAE